MQMFVEAVFYGNATAAEAAALVNLVTARVAGAPLEQDLRFESRIVNLSYGLEYRYAVTLM